MSDEPIKTEEKRNPDGTFAPGTSGGPGRPKGQSMKEYWREKFYAMTPEQKEAFAERVGANELWRMAEGNPKQDTDITTAGRPIIMLAPEVVDKNAINTEPVNDSQG